MKPYLVTKLVDGKYVYCKRMGSSAEQVCAIERAKGVNVVKVIPL